MLPFGCSVTLRSLSFFSLLCFRSFVATLSAVARLLSVGKLLQPTPLIVLLACGSLRAAASPYSLTSADALATKSMYDKLCR